MFEVVEVDEQLEREREEEDGTSIGHFSSQPISEESEERITANKKKKTAQLTVNDEFFGVYCLISQSPLKQYKNRCYIGYTVDPNRRIRQHNSGKQFGGAAKTDSRGPWKMVCIVQGFPNAVSALRFEWAWQNPQKSRRLRGLGLRKSPRESPFAFRLRIAAHMLRSDPWIRLALAFRWLAQEEEIPFPDSLPLPSHMNIIRGPVMKTRTFVPLNEEDYKPIAACRSCSETIHTHGELVRCISSSCDAYYHMNCLAGHCGDVNCLVPLTVTCLSCGREHLWGDLIRDQRLLILVAQVKPVFGHVQSVEATKLSVPRDTLIKI